jgi:hypothetical protein
MGYVFKYVCVNKPVELDFLVGYVWSGPPPPKGLAPLTPLGIGVVDATADHGRLSKDHWEFTSEKVVGRRFTYTPLAEGDEELTFHVEFGVPGGKNNKTIEPPPVVRFKVLHCEYHVTFQGERVATYTKQGAVLESNNTFSGEGDFDVVPDPNGFQYLLVQGNGTYKVELLLTLRSQDANCVSTSKPKGEGTLKILGSADEDGNLDFSIFMDPTTVTGQVDTCQWKQGTTVKAIPGHPHNNQTQNLMDLQFPMKGGNLTFSGPPFDNPPPNTVVSEKGQVKVERRGAK